MAIIVSRRESLRNEKTGFPLSPAAIFAYHVGERRRFGYPFLFTVPGILNRGRSRGKTLFEEIEA